MTWDTTLVAPGAHSVSAVARDAAGQTTTAAVSVTVLDTTPPTVAMTAPAPAANVSGTVTVSATASDNVGGGGGQVKLDGANLGAEVTAAPYTMAWDTTLVAVGGHSVSAVARDAAGHTATAAVSVTVLDTTPPTVALTAPAPAATVSGTVTVSATATDNVGVVGVQFKIDGTNLGAEVTTAPYSLAWDTTLAAPGGHSVSAVARDAAGHTASAAVSVTVADTTPPTVALSAPAPAASVSGAVTVSATATDNVGVVGVQFQLDGVNLGAEVTAAPYTVVWDTTLAAVVGQSVSGVARDVAVH